MKIKKVVLQALLALSIIHCQLSIVHAQGTAFTYQGRLNDSGGPANGNYDITFAIYDAVANGNILVPPITNAPTVASNGLFNVTLDFGAGIFTGPARWLEIAVRTNGSVGAYATLSPRQPLTANPYAIFAGTASNLSGTLPAANLAGTYVSAVTLNNGGNIFDGTFSGNGTNLSNVNAASLGGLSAGQFWQLTGNAGTTPGSNFVGTTDNQPLQLWANGTRALLLDGTANATLPNVIGGSRSNSVASGVYGATIGGGYANTMQTNATESTISGGVGNAIQINARQSTIAGGFGNTIQSNAIKSTVGGGQDNIIQTNAQYAVIPGGLNNLVAGNYGVALGQQAQALYQGDFVWADSSNAPFASTTNDQFLIRANGGVGINTNNPNGSALNVNGTVMATAFAGNGAGLTNLSAAQLTGFSQVTPPASGYPILNMVWIVPGTFIMGTPTSDPDYASDETQHVVTLTNGFWMGQHPVTQGEYLAVMGNNPSSFTGDLSRPVESITWFNAGTFCTNLTQNEQSAGRLPSGWVYRLPTESEWEYCCRALTTSRYYFGNDPGDGTSLANYAWYSVNSGNTTQPVGQLLPNAWGLVDMAGNVFEWCQDWYGTYPTANVSYNPRGPATGSDRVLRGGGWDGPAGGCRSANRYYYDPASEGIAIGFRVVLAPGP